MAAVDRSPGPYYGLPKDLDEGVEISNWADALRFVETVSGASRPIVITVRGDEVECMQQIGYLRAGGITRMAGEEVAGRTFWIEPIDIPHATTAYDQWFEGRHEAGIGVVSLYEHLFERANLRTLDEDDCFWLQLWFGSWSVLFQDKTTGW